MLEYRKVNDDILEVKETTMSFIKTFVRYSYYNIKTWYKSDVVKEPTNNPVCFIKMSENSINWVKKYYIPKIENYINEK